MTEVQPLMIAVAPNGARKTSQDHSAIPLTPATIADTATDCLNQGACMIHLHVREHDGSHSLDPALYQDAICAIRDRVGDKLVVQITTEAVGIYTPSQQMEVVKKVHPEAVSIAIRELCPADCDEQELALFFDWIEQKNILVQYILYSVEDIQRFYMLKEKGIINTKSPSLLLVLGRYSTTGLSQPQELLPLLHQLQAQRQDRHSEANDVNWWTCAFGYRELACMLTTAGLGGHCRVGFENNTKLYSGETAPTNAALVAQLAQSAGKMGRALATADDARALLGKR